VRESKEWGVNAIALDREIGHDTAETFDRRFSDARPTLLAICASVIGREEAQDAVQEVYVRARERIGQLRNPALFEAWLARIALNEARSIWRRHRRDPGSLPPNLVRASGSSSRDPALIELVERLPPRERACVVLHYGYGYSTHEIGRLLRVSSLNTRTILFRARRRLRRELEASDE
jgi:RNA polymerase sigma-70 factor, ECF subfamily